jgi:CRP/FNR family cyclic AMP-dependent transcriptional regulator
MLQRKALLDDPGWFAAWQVSQFHFTEMSARRQIDYYGRSLVPPREADCLLWCCWCKSGFRSKQEQVNAREQKRVLAVLRKSTWFTDLPEELQLLIVHRSILKNCPKGHVVSHEDTKPKGLFAVIKGQVALTRLVAEDQQFFYYLGGPGFWFGEYAALAGSPTLVTVTSRTALEYLVLPIGKLDSILQVHPLYFRDFVKLPLDRAAVVIRSLAQAHMLSPEANLRLRLADVCDLFLREGTAQGALDLAMSQYDLAQMIGCSRQTVNGLLQELENRQLIKVGFRKITVLNVEALRQV